MEVGSIEYVRDHMIAECSQFSIDTAVCPPFVVSVQILYVLEKHERRPFDIQNILDSEEHLATVFAKALLVAHHTEWLARETRGEHLEIGEIGNILLVCSELNNVTECNLVWRNVVYRAVSIQRSAIYLGIADALKIHKPVLGQ